MPEAGPLLAGEYRCGCANCRQAASPTEVFADVAKLTAHNLWTICDSVRRLRERMAAGCLEQWMDHLLERHLHWFPESRLGVSWSELHE